MTVLASVVVSSAVRCIAAVDPDLAVLTATLVFDEPIEKDNNSLDRRSRLDLAPYHAHRGAS